MTHTGTAKPLRLSLSTRSMTAACGHTLQVKYILKEEHVPNNATDKTSLSGFRFRCMGPVPHGGHRYPGATASKWLPKALGFPNLHKDYRELRQ